jgi:hypothetical protein
MAIPNSSGIHFRNLLTFVNATETGEMRGNDGISFFDVKETVLIVCG